MGLLEKVKGKLQQWRQNLMFLDVLCVVLLDRERLMSLSQLIIL